MFIMETQQICMKFPKWYSGYKIKKASQTAGCLTTLLLPVTIRQSFAKPRRSDKPAPLPAGAQPVLLLPAQAFCK